MKKKKMCKILTSAAMILVLMFSMIGCGSSDETVSKDNSGTDDVNSSEIPISDTLTVASNAEANTPDTHINVFVIDREISRPIFEGLFEYDDTNTPQKQLCEDYTANEDFTEWTFTLRKGVMFHNGKEMKAEDVVASLNRWLDCGMTPAVEYIGDNRFEAVDDYTVKIKLSKGVTIMPYLLCNNKCFALITTKEACEDADEVTGLKEYIGTGPYKFVEYIPGNYIKYERYADYQGPGYEATGEAGDRNAYFNNLVYKFVPDDSIRTSGCMSGENDITEGISYDDISLFEEDSNYQLLKHTAGLGTVYYNKGGDSLLKDDNIRQAVHYAIDAQALLNAIVPVEGYSDFSCGWQQNTNPFYTEAGEEYWKVDQEKAKEYLEKSSYNGESIRLVASQAWSNLYNASLLLQEELEEVGFNVELVTGDGMSIYERTYTDTGWELYVMWGENVDLPTNLAMASPFSSTYCSNETLLNLKEKFLATDDIDERKEIAEEMQIESYKNAESKGLGFVYDAYVAKNDIQNISVYKGVIPWNCYK